MSSYETSAVAAFAPRSDPTLRAFICVALAHPRGGVSGARFTRRVASGLEAVLVFDAPVGRVGGEIGGGRRVPR